jgi:hypothetical protein
VEQTFTLPDRMVGLVLDAGTRRVLGGQVLRQMAPAAPAPCASPGPVAGVILTAVGVGTARYYPFSSPAGAIAAAAVLAGLDLAASYPAFRNAMCPSFCPPPCQCVANVTFPPTPDISVAPVKLFGITVAFDVTVTLDLSFTLTCV